MKQLLCFVTTLVLATQICYGQPNTIVDNRKIYISASSDLSVTNNNSNRVTLWNSHAETKENKRKNVVHSATGAINLYVSRTYSDGEKQIILDIYDKNWNTGNMKYSVLNEKGKRKWTRDIYWGIEIYMTGTDGKEYMVEYFFNNREGHKSYHLSGYGSLHGKFDNGWNKTYYELPSRITLTLTNDSGRQVCLIEPNSLGIAQNASNIREVKKIVLKLGPGAQLDIYNLTIKQQRNTTTTSSSSASKPSSTSSTKTGTTKTGTTSSTSKASSNYVEDCIENGDKQMQLGNYAQAAQSYTQAIISGRKNYQIYIKRAKAYFNMESYKFVIDDCTNAMIYSKTNEAYLMRGLAKLYSGDTSGVDDLDLAGEEGKAVLRKLEKLIEEQEAENKAQRATTPPRKEKELVKEQNVSTPPQKGRSLTKDSNFKID